MNNVRREAGEFLVGYLIATVIGVSLFYTMPTWIHWLPDMEFIKLIINSGSVGVVLGWAYFSFLAIIKLFDFIKGYK